MVYSVFKNGITVNSFKYSKDAIKSFHEEVRLARQSTMVYYLSLGYFNARMEIIDLIYVGNSRNLHQKETVEFSKEYYQLLIDDL